MAAEVLAQGGAGVTVYDAMPSAGRKFLMAGRGGLNLTHSEALPAISRALRRGDAASRARDRGISAGSRCAHGAKRWGSRPSSAPAAGCFRKRSRPRRCCGRGCGGWTRSGVQFALRHRWTGWDDDGHLVVSDTGRTARRRCPRDRAGARRRQLAAARLRRCVGGNARREGRDDIAAATRQLRLHRRLVRIFSAIVSKASRSRAWRCRSARTRCAAKPSSRAPASRAARSMRCRLICARPSSTSGQATLHIALRPDLEVGRADRAVVRAARQTIVFQFPAQGGASVAGRASACCRRRRSHPAHRCRRCRRQSSPD